MGVLAGNVRAVFWVAAIPAIAAVLALVIGVEEPPRPVDARPRAALPRWSDLSTLGRPFWLVVMTGVIFTLARFSEAFLIVRAMDAGLSMNWTPLALAVMNVTYVVSAYPVGKLSDRVGRRGLLLIGLAILIGADIVLIVATQLSVVLMGIALWGLHLGLTQGLLSALVADTAPADLRGSAFGVFYCATGIAAVVSSVLAGVLWEQLGPPYTFGAGAIFAAIAIAAFWWQHIRNSKESHRPPGG
jgi:MFS family permease